MQASTPSTSEVDTTDPEEFIRTVKAIAPTFGHQPRGHQGPECFEIETRLREELDIPPDARRQHGTAIISSAALLNGAKIAGKSWTKCASWSTAPEPPPSPARACSSGLGIRRENMVLCDSHGAVTALPRGHQPDEKREFATTRRITTLAEALHDADVSWASRKADTLTPEMLRTMSGNPIVMASANPDPRNRLRYRDALAPRHHLRHGPFRTTRTRSTTCWASAISGALDVRATKINEEMKLRRGACRPN